MLLSWRVFLFWDACFLDLGTLFLDLYMFFGSGRIFFGPGSASKNVGTCRCVFWTLRGYFFGTCMYLCWTQVFFLTAKLIVSDVGFFFLDPCTCFVDLASIGWGELHCYRRSHRAFFLGPWRLTCTCFFGPGTGWEEFRY